MRLPFIVRWSGQIAAKQISTRTVISAVDFLPTLCAVANITMPDTFNPDGEKMLPALLGKEIGDHAEGWSRWAVRDGDWKLLTDNAVRREMDQLVEDTMKH